MDDLKHTESALISEDRTCQLFNEDDFVNHRHFDTVKQFKKGRGQEAREQEQWGLKGHEEERDGRRGKRDGRDEELDERGEGSIYIKALMKKFCRQIQLDSDLRDTKKWFKNYQSSFY